MRRGTPAHERQCAPLLADRRADGTAELTEARPRDVGARGREGPGRAAPRTALAPGGQEGRAAAELRLPRRAGGGPLGPAGGWALPPPGEQR